LLLSAVPFAFSQGSTPTTAPDNSNPPAATSSAPSGQQPSSQPADTPAETKDAGAQASTPQSTANDTTPPPPPAQPAPENSGTKEKVKPGSKNDVDAIGNRDVGKGGGLGNWYSLEKEIRMGKEFAQQVEASVKLVQDPVVNEYVNRIGQNLVRN